MEVFTIQNSYPRLFNTAVTLGKFDGIHKGHRKLTEKILEQKKEGRTAVLFAIESGDSWIYSKSERRRLLERLGIDVLIEAPLDERMRTMKAESFVNEILVGDLGAAYVAVGEDNRFGFERRGDWRLLQKMGPKAGFEVEVVPRQMDGKRKISSTYIREELTAGHMEKAAALAGTPYYLSGEIVHGKQFGRTYGIPTINMIPQEGKLLPPFGVYVSRVTLEKKTYRGVTNIGVRPTVSETGNVNMETFLFDFDGDVYGDETVLELLHYIRPEKKFSSLEELETQIKADANTAVNWKER